MGINKARRAGVAAIVALAVTVPAIQGADAAVPQREPRRIIAILIGVVDDHPEFSGKVVSKHDIRNCVSHVPVQIQRRNEDATWSNVAAGDTKGNGEFSIEIPNESGTYRAVARGLKVDWGDGIIKCRVARSESLTCLAYPCDSRRWQLRNYHPGI
jgi:hypothetical protein